MPHKKKEQALVGWVSVFDRAGAGKILACLEGNFQRGRDGASIKGRDFYDLLWFMQKIIHPLEEKLQKDGSRP